MNRIARVRLLMAPLLALALLGSLAATGLAAPPDGTFERVIVVLHDDVSGPAAVGDEVARRHNGRRGFVYEHALKGFVVEVPAGAVAGIARDPRVASVEPDQRVWAFDVPTGVNRIEADKKTGADDNAATSPAVTANVDIAIIDTGIAAHSDLNTYRAVSCTNGLFFASCQASAFSDGDGHGTHVAGTAAAKDDGTGVVGVAPGARLWQVKVLDDTGSGYMSWIVAGVDYVANNAAYIEVANMSLGCECSSSSLDRALANAAKKGVVTVVAAGNSGKDAATFSPAKHSQVITVSAVADYNGRAGGGAPFTCRSDVGADDTFATFSNYGSVVDLAAPGVCIRSTVPRGGYAEYSGTSMASPHVAGAAGLYIVEKGVARTSNRWSVVRDGLRANWAVPQADPCGFSGGKSSEPLLLLAKPCN